MPEMRQSALRGGWSRSLKRFPMLLLQTDNAVAKPRFYALPGVCQQCCL